MEVRRHFEPEIAAMAAEHTTRADVEWMREILDHASQRLELEEHVRWDTAFHQALARATGNPIYEIIMSSMAAAGGESTSAVRHRRCRRPRLRPPRRGLRGGGEAGC
ncbi:MAG: FCD domain-containing protein [Candidatus Dormibacteraeota bacterium]|nr:FCD domain-containing protein [Candidatus Dormibacteraeota bacterium]